MINHVSIGVRDIARAKKFYDAVLGSIGYDCKSQGDSYLGYGASGIQFWLLQSAAPVAPDMRSGLHFCFDAPSRAAVDAFYRLALQDGGQDNGPPGLRPDYGPNYYAAFVIDPEGYRIEAYCSKAG